MRRRTQGPLSTALSLQYDAPHARVVRNRTSSLHINTYSRSKRLARSLLLLGRDMSASPTPQPPAARTDGAHHARPRRALRRGARPLAAVLAALLALLAPAGRRCAESAGGVREPGGRRVGVRRYHLYGAHSGGQRHPLRADPHRRLDRNAGGRPGGDLRRAAGRRVRRRSRPAGRPCR